PAAKVENRWSRCGADKVASASRARQRALEEARAIGDRLPAELPLGPRVVEAACRRPRREVAPARRLHALAADRELDAVLRDLFQVPEGDGLRVEDEVALQSAREL